MTEAVKVVRMGCHKCSGKGWIMGAKYGWADICVPCGGKGSYTYRALGDRIGEPADVLMRVDELRARPGTARRVLTSLAKSGFVR